MCKSISRVNVYFMQTINFIEFLLSHSVKVLLQHFSLLFCKILSKNVIACGFTYKRKSKPIHRLLLLYKSVTDSKIKHKIYFKE